MAGTYNIVMVTLMCVCAAVKTPVSDSSVLLKANCLLLLNTWTQSNLTQPNIPSSVSRLPHGGNGLINNSFCLLTLLNHCLSLPFISLRFIFKTDYFEGKNLFYLIS